MTIQLDVPHEFDIEAFKRKSYDTKQLKELFSLFEFETLGKKLFGKTFSTASSKAKVIREKRETEIQATLFDEPVEEKTIADVPHDYRLVTTESERSELIEALKKQDSFCFDTETTGLSVEKDDVVQLGAVRVLNGRIVHGEVVDTYVNPGRPIPPASTLIHQVTDGDVAGAPDFATAGRNFHHFARDAVLVAHNAPFDIGLLRRCASDMGVDWSHPVLDTVLLSAAVFGTTEDHSLDALCERLSITIPHDLRHTAIGDAQATAQVLVKLIPLLEGKGLVRFGQVIAETQRHGRLLQDLNKRQSEKPVGGTDVGRPSQTGQS
mgnify:CR=1 FL=1